MIAGLALAFVALAYVKHNAAMKERDHKLAVQHQAATTGQSQTSTPEKPDTP